MNRARPSLGRTGPVVSLLPGFDEYLLGYRDRSASLDPLDAQKIQPGSNGMFAATIVINGKITGTWKRVFAKKSVAISTDLFRSLTKAKARALEEAMGRYVEFRRVVRWGEAARRPVKTEKSRAL